MHGSLRFRARPLSWSLPWLLSLLLLSGCYADLDWRELKSTEGGFKVLMPARARETSGPATGGATLILWTTEAGGAVFGAGHADYPAGAAAQLTTSRDWLARNVRGKVTADQEAKLANLSGRAITIDGFAADGTPRVVHARLYASGQRLFELAVIAKPGAISAADLDMFFGSFEP